MVRLVRSAAALGTHDGRAVDWRPSPGDVRVRTRADGIFFVPAELLPAVAQSVALSTGGACFRPLKANGSGVWFFAAEYRDAYTDLNATFVTGCSGGPPRGGLGTPGWLFRREARTTAAATARAERDERFLLGAVDAPDPWFYSGFLRSGSPEKRVQVSVCEPAGGGATLRVALFGYSHDDRIDPDHELIVSVNDRPVADLRWDGRGYEVLELGLPEGALREGANTVGLLTPELEELPRGHGAALD